MNIKSEKLVLPEAIRAPDGLYGVSVAETSISKGTPDGSLTFRGYPIKELVEKASFEECVFLVLEGRLPRRAELDELVKKLHAHAKVPESVYDVMRRLPSNSNPMDVLRTAVSALGAAEAFLQGRDQQLSLIAKMPALAANCQRVVSGLPPIEPDPSLNHASSLLYMITGKVPNGFDSKVFERILILYLEHDLNVSSFTVRVVASTLADVYASATAGMAALKGPLHGGANEAAMAMLLEVGSAENAEKYLQDALAHGKKIMGFGHRIYKKVDPRAQLAKGQLKILLREKGDPLDLYRLCDALADAMWSSKKIPPNLDFYAAPIFYTLSIPIPLFTPVFASSRIVGWTAHYNEQLSHNKLFRPDATYSGPNDLAYIPIEDR